MSSSKLSFFLPHVGEYPETKLTPIHHAQESWTERRNLREEKVRVLSHREPQLEAGKDWGCRV